MTAVAYAPSMRAGFLYDDERSVERNMALRAPDAVRLPGLREMLGPARPLTSVTFALDWRAAGLDPGRFHRTGLLLHLAAVAMAFLFLRRILLRVGHPRAPWLALAAAALFALHPVQVESVAYVSQRAEVLASLLFLGALLLLDGAVARGGSWRGVAAWGGGIVTWVAAMGAKTIAVSLPGAFLVDQAVLAPAGERGRAPALRRVRRALILALPVLLLAAWSAILQFGTFAADPRGGAGFTATSLSPVQYLLTQFRVQWLYLRLLAWPGGFSFDRSFPASTGLDGEVLLAGAGVLALVGLALAAWRRAERGQGDAAVERPLAFGILLWFVALSPTSSLVPLLDLAVEHRVYLASLGPFLAATVVADAALRRLPRIASGVAETVLAVLVLAALTSALHGRAVTWASPVAVWREALLASPGNVRVMVNLAIDLRKTGSLAAAEAELRRAWALASRPDSIAIVAQNYGAILIDVGRRAEAVPVLERGLQVAPEDPVLRVNLSVALGLLGRFPESLAEARRAVLAAPGSPMTRNNLGVALVASGDLPAGLAEFQGAEALDPGNPVLPITAAIALARLGHRAEACTLFQHARGAARGRPLPRNGVLVSSRIGCPIE